jgi:hypothetical protein
MYSGQKGRMGLLLIILACFSFCGCSSRLGWGVLLWSTEDPAIPSGTVLPVHIRSNINKLWVVGLPDGWRNSKDGVTMLEIPLARFELVGSRKKALARSQAFAQYALIYAENLQDGLPIREFPDNSSTRVYRLRSGEVVKILSLSEGNPVISATGDPLPGDWYRVLTVDGSTGYCFSYRLKLFEYSGGQLAASESIASETADDPHLDMLLSKLWSPESYHTMLHQNRINLAEISRKWYFDPGQDSGTARIYMPGIDRTFTYTGIRPNGTFSWRFEGTSLVMQMRSESIIGVQYTETSGASRTLVFVSLPITVDDLIIQESARRERLYETIYQQGPVFTSNNYGSIVFDEGGEFTWSGFDLLVPQYIPETVEGTGTVSIDMFLGPALEDRYNGAFTLRFSDSNTALRCMYVLDNQGFRIEIAPESSIEDVTIVHRASSPMVLYFFKDEELW